MKKLTSVTPYTLTLSLLTRILPHASYLAFLYFKSTNTKMAEGYRKKYTGAAWKTAASSS